MSSWLSFVILAAAAFVVAEGRAIPAEPVSLMMDSYGNPILFLREKRTPVRPYPHQAMMFTGYYRPVRGANDEQGTGVYAQGNAVSGGSYLGDGQPDYLQRGPEPIDEAEVSSAEAEAAPNPLEHHVDEEEQRIPLEKEQHEQEESQPAEDVEQSSVTTESEPAVEEASVQPTTVSRRPTKKHGGKKTKKTPVVIEAEDSEESEEDEDEEEDDDEPAVPFVPFKTNRHRGNVPNLNNFFPMVFSYPHGVTRNGASETNPGMITAIANSYSTGKGGVASSVATAYGGSPQGKKQQRRAQPTGE